MRQVPQDKLAPRRGVDAWSVWRPMTLVYISMTNRGAVGNETKKLVCFVDSHEYRAANETYTYTMQSRKQHKLGRPRRVHLEAGLGCTIHRPQPRHRTAETVRDLSDLDKSVAIHEEAIGLSPVRSPRSHKDHCRPLCFLYKAPT